MSDGWRIEMKRHLLINAMLVLAAMSSSVTKANAGAPLRCASHKASSMPTPGVDRGMPRLVVTVFDYAGAGSRDIDVAERIVADTYRRAGVAIDWLDACVQDALPGLLLNLLPNAMANRASCPDSALGVAVPGTTVASVFYDKVNEAAMRYRVAPRALLAHAMAHEIGHLLLGPGAHSPSGIMQAALVPPAMSEANESFTREQSVGIVRSAERRAQE
jgi:hypothetical protein